MKGEEDWKKLSFLISLNFLSGFFLTMKKIFYCITKILYGLLDAKTGFFWLKGERRDG